MAEADEESSTVFSTLGRELDVLVPTQRLWSRINETIEIEKGSVTVWQKLVAYITTSLLNPSVAAAAGILLMLGMFAVVVSVRDGMDNSTASTGSAPNSSASTVAPETAFVDVTTDETGVPAPSAPAPSVTISNHPPKKLEALAVQANAKASQRDFTPQQAVYNPDAYLPGEERYVRTIADLKQNVDTQKEAVLTPSTRVSYDRDMAVVNDSIKRMREVVRRNPRNQAARQVLYASYQDKIDLLNSVSQREELMAQLR
jgi:hypothetical protein